MSDPEQNRFSARATRYARVGANIGGVAARMAGSRLRGADDGAGNAAALTRALGGLKGPLMKVAQLLSTIPDALPADYAEALQQLQSQAPAMGAAFVGRRMRAELGPDWQSRFGSFDLRPAAAASLGQVHRATTHDGAPLACKLQYPDMSSAVEADLAQLKVLFAIHRRMSPAIDAGDAISEIGARIREELDYRREARHAALYRLMLAEIDEVRVPDVHLDLSTDRLLTMGWLEGDKLLSFKDAAARHSQPDRDRHVQGLVASVQPLRRDPRRPASRQLFDPLDGQAAAVRRFAASTFSTMAACASSRRSSSAASSIFITACARTTAHAWCMPTRPGASGSSTIP